MTEDFDPQKLIFIEARGPKTMLHFSSGVTGKIFWVEIGFVKEILTRMFSLRQKYSVFHFCCHLVCN
jgi:hypothetical protein